MKTFIFLFVLVVFVALNYSCKKKIPVIEHSISGVLYLDHTLQPAANYEVRLQYNSQAYSLRDTKILDECTTDENGNFYLKYVKIAGGGELEIENSGGTALLTEIPVNEDINFSFPIKPFVKVEYNFNYNKPLSINDTVFVFAEQWIEKKSQPSIVFFDSLQLHYLMLTHNFQPDQIIFNVGISELNYSLLQEKTGINFQEICNIPYFGLGFENTVKNHKHSTTFNSYQYEPDSTYYSFCLIEEYLDPFNAKSTININLPD